jgi:excinuclease UvrABC ATPase subunit
MGSMSKNIQSFKVKPGVCPACLGSGGEIYTDYTDENDRYELSKFIVCPACQGSGTDDYLKVGNKFKSNI